MITIFNRKEVCLTFDLKRQAEVRSILQINNINYIVKVLNRKSPSPIGGGSRTRTGTFGEDLSKEYEYKIYVHKDDYELALHLISK